MNATTNATMKAIVYPRYGSPDVLQLAEVEKPVPKDDQVLVRIHAASLNAYDRVVRGRPLLIRVFTRNGLRRPKDQRLGVNLAGRVEAVGGAVTRFRVGDEVYGSAAGAFAEYACAREDQLAAKPANVSFEAAATVPTAGRTALHALRDHGHVQAGQQVLINGASGGVARSPCRSPRRSGRRSPPCAAPRAWRRPARSGPTTSSITRGRISPSAGGGGGSGGATT